MNEPSEDALPSRQTCQTLHLKQSACIYKFFFFEGEWERYRDTLEEKAARQIREGGFKKKTLFEAEYTVVW